LKPPCGRGVALCQANRRASPTGRLNRFVSKVEMGPRRLLVLTQQCCIVPVMVSSCPHGRPCATQKPCLGVPESLLQELSNDAPNFFQALSRQILAFGKIRNRSKTGHLHLVTNLLLITIRQTRICPVLARLLPEIMKTSQKIWQAKHSALSPYLRVGGFFHSRERTKRYFSSFAHQSS